MIVILSQYPSENKTVSSDSISLFIFRCHFVMSLTAIQFTCPMHVVVPFHRSHFSASFGNCCAKSSTFDTFLHIFQLVIQIFLASIDTVHSTILDCSWVDYLSNLSFDLTPCPGHCLHSSCPSFSSWLNRTDNCHILSSLQDATLFVLGFTETVYHSISHFSFQQLLLQSIDLSQFL